MHVREEHGRDRRVLLDQFLGQVNQGKQGSARARVRQQAVGGRVAHQGPLELFGGAARVREVGVLQQLDHARTHALRAELQAANRDKTEGVRRGSSVMQQGARK